MKRLVIACHVDPFYRPNNRVHQLIAGLRRYCDDVTVVYIRHVHNATLGKKLRSFFSLSTGRFTHDGVVFISVDPLLRPGHHQRTLVDRTVPQAVHLRRRPLKTALLELIGVAGFALEWTYSWSMYAAYRRHYRGRCDAVIGQSLSPYGFAIMLKSKRLARVAVADDFDYLPGNYLNSAARMALARWRENSLFRRMDVVISVGELLAGLRRSETGRDAEVIPNGVDYARFAVAQHKPPHPPTVMYVGTLIEWTGLDLCLAAFRRTLERVPEARMIIVGQGLPDYVEHIESLIRDPALEGSVEFLGEQPYDRLPEIFRRVDVGLAVFQPIALRKYAFSMKVVDYLAAGICPVVTEGIESGHFVESHACGVAVPYTADAIAEAITALLEAPERRAGLVARGMEVARQLDWEALMRRYDDCIESALAADPGNGGARATG